MERVRHYPQRAERLTTVAAVPAALELPSYEDVLAEFTAVEQQDGWLARCADRRQYVARNREFVLELAGSLRACGSGPVLEVCAGDGRLAECLRQSGVDVIATDAAPPARRAGSVARLTAAEALAAYRPRVVLGGFVPAGAGVDDLVFGAPSVVEYVVLNARIWGEFGSASLWTGARWTALPLDQVSRWMISRHDVWLGDDVAPLHRGEAWRFSRVSRRPA